MQDVTAVALGLVLGTACALAFTVIFLGVQTSFEAIGAVVDLGTFVNRVMQDQEEDIAAVWLNVQAYLEKGFEAARDNFNTTEWWPIMESLRGDMQNGSNMTEMVMSTRDTACTIYNHTAWFSQADSVLSKAMEGDDAGIWDDVQRVVGQLDMSVLLEYAKTYAFEVMTNPVVVVVQVISKVGAVISAVSTLGGQFVLFMFFVVTMLCESENVLQRAVQLVVPASPGLRARLASELRKMIEGVLFLPLQLASLNAVMCFLIYSLLGVDFKHFATFLVLTFTIVPLLDAWYVCIPWSMALMLASRGEGRWLSITKGVLLLVVFYFVFDFINSKVYEVNQKLGRVTNPLLTALSIALGFGLYGWKGTVLCPLCVCFLIVLCRIRLDPLVMERGGAAPSTLIINVYEHGKKDSTFTRIRVHHERGWDAFVQQVKDQLPVSPTHVTPLLGKGRRKPAPPSPHQNNENPSVAEFTAQKPGCPRITLIDDFIDGESVCVRFVPAPSTRAEPPAPSALRSLLPKIRFVEDDTKKSQ